MKINTLELTNVRGFTHAKLEFQTGFNLIVGINGVGKTTVLESLRVVLSHLLPESTVSKNKKDHFDSYDIQIEKESLQLNASLSLGTSDYSFVLTKQKASTKVVETEDIRNQTFEVNNEPVFKPTISKEHKNQTNQPLGIFFSSHRSLMNEEKASKSQTVGGQAIAFADALHNKREFSIRLFADWFLAQEALAIEKPDLLIKINTIKEAIYTFLPGFSNLSVIKDLRGEKNTFSIIKNKKTLSLQQLSDGERSLLTVVLDIARRLTIANATLENPLYGEAVILIDELDLHLHPKWQRTVVSDLKRTFPNCQFIATTHSPQIISSVLPENIQIIKNFEVDQTIKSFGLDINWILKFIMEDSDRLKESDEAIAAVQKLINDIEFDEARTLIEKYKAQNLDLSEWVMFEAQMAHLELFEDEENN
ncbi:AAA family ATPase [Flavobacterium johnsoniae]|uniref:AAA family ATPase n=1 Tax=Flavobacterium johnsoniae TaxID=986 RepID=UPI0025AED6B9|nr:AAA family ATPase [Flavobacterium johnsoniae]WJS96778.1 AAA family ATPase [Flavobacterium johnsoniae]